MTEPLTQSPSAERVGELLRELMGTIIQRSAGEMMRVMAAEGLSMPQMVALHILRNCGPQSISTIADKLSLSLGATSHLVDRMVQHKLVLRYEDTVDRRQKRVAIADNGRVLLERLVHARLREATQITALLPPELRGELEQVLEQVVEQLRLIGE